MSEVAPNDARLQRASVIERRIGDSLIILAVGNREVRLLGPTAAGIWQALAHCHSTAGLEALLAETYPNVEPVTRQHALSTVLDDLVSDGFVLSS